MRGRGGPLKRIKPGGLLREEKMSLDVRRRKTEKDSLMRETAEAREEETGQERERGQADPARKT